MNWVPRPGLQVLLEPDCRLLLIERDDDQALPRAVAVDLDSRRVRAIRSSHRPARHGGLLEAQNGWDAARIPLATGEEGAGSPLTEVMLGRPLSSYVALPPNDVRRVDAIRRC